MNDIVHCFFWKPFSSFPVYSEWNPKSEYDSLFNYIEPIYIFSKRDMYIYQEIQETSWKWVKQLVFDEKNTFR